MRIKLIENTLVATTNSDSHKQPAYWRRTIFQEEDVVLLIPHLRFAKDAERNSGDPWGVLPSGPPCVEREQKMYDWRVKLGDQIFQDSYWFVYLRGNGGSWRVWYRQALKGENSLIRDGNPQSLLFSGTLSFIPES